MIQRADELAAHCPGKGFAFERLHCLMELTGREGGRNPGIFPRDSCCSTRCGGFRAA